MAYRASVGRLVALSCAHNRTTGEEVGTRNGGSNSIAAFKRDEGRDRVIEAKALFLHDSPRVGQDLVAAVSQRPDRSVHWKSQDFGRIEEGIAGNRGGAFITKATSESHDNR